MSKTSDSQDFQITKGNKRAFFLSKTKAAFVHFLLGFIIIIPIILFIRFQLYPGILLDVTGVKKILLIIFTADLCLGPSLTFLVYKKNKKTLRFDLTVIVCVQLLALGYGTYTLWAGRPVYIASSGARFEIVQAPDILEKNIKASPKPLPVWGPEWVGTKIPDDVEQRNEVTFSAIFGQDYGYYPQHHTAFSDMYSQHLQYARPLSELLKDDKEKRTVIQDWLIAHSLEESQVLQMPAKAREADFTVLINAKTGAVLDMIQLDPW